MNNFPAGPWRVNPYNKRQVVTKTDSNPAYVVAYAPNSKDGVATLIAAAPDLLETLSSVLRIMEYNAPHETSPAITLAKAAIARATTTTP